MTYDLTIYVETSTRHIKEQTNPVAWIQETNPDSHQQFCWSWHGSSACRKYPQLSHLSGRRGHMGSAGGSVHQHLKVRETQCEITFRYEVVCLKNPVKVRAVNSEGDSHNHTLWWLSDASKEVGTFKRFGLKARRGLMVMTLLIKYQRTNCGLSLYCRYSRIKVSALSRTIS